MQRNNIYILIAVLGIFLFAIVYVVRYQTSSVHEIFKFHREQLQNEIKAIQEERQKLRLTIDSLERSISAEQVGLLNDINDFLKKHDKK